MRLFRELRSRRRSAALPVQLAPSVLPTAEPPSGRQELKGHNGNVFRVVALPKSGLIATACNATVQVVALPESSLIVTACNATVQVVALPESGLVTTARDATVQGTSDALRIFALDEDGEPLHTLDFKFARFGFSLAAVGDDVLACGGIEGRLMTCRASTGERLESLQLGSRSEMTAFAAVGDGVFVAGCYDGALVSLAHTDGRNLRVVAQYKSAFENWIYEIAVRGDVVVAASAGRRSADETAAVWSAATHKRLAVLRGQGNTAVRAVHAAICDRFIATCAGDKSIRLYENRGRYSLVRVLDTSHTEWVRYVEFVDEDLLISASEDKTLAFTSVSTGKTMARVDVGFKIHSVAILADGRIACVGENYGAIILSPPVIVADEVKRHATTLFPSPLALSMSETEPLQSAMMEMTKHEDVGSVDLGSKLEKECLDVSDLAFARAGQTSDISALDIGSTLSRLQVGFDEDGSAFNLEELKAAASNAELVQKMNCDELSRTTAAVMTDFQESGRSHLPALTQCICSVLGELCVGGVAFVRFPEAELLGMMVAGLRENALYTRSFSKPTTRIFEWHLERFIQHLRL